MINIGIVGFGRIGNDHTTWINATRRARAVATADPTPARRKLAEERGLRTYAEPQELFSDPSIDAILISTPTAMHFDHAMRALEAGKHVMIEKPMALDLEQSRRIADEAHRHGRVISVFHNRRWDLDYLTVKKAVQSGVLGQIINVESRLHQWASCVGPAAREYHPNWRNEAAYGGGGLYDWGSHFVDQIWRLLHPARPVRVFAQLRANVWTRDCDDFARVCIDFDSGAVAMVEINTTTTRPLPRWHVDGTLGSADSPHSAEFDTKVWARLDFTPAGQSQSQRISPADPGLSETDIWEAFAAAVAGQGEVAVPVQSVLPTMALLDAARASARGGCVVNVEDTIDWRV